MKLSKHSIYDLKQIGPLSPIGIIISVSILFTIDTLFTYYRSIHTPELVWVTNNSFAVFAPIYEEIIFRGLLLSLLLKRFPTKQAALISTLLFGLWHLKNIFYLPPGRLLYQIFYAGLIIGPVLTYLRFRTKSIWPGVILHYVNNIWAPISQAILSFPL